MVSLEQLEALISFMESHKDLALGRGSRTKEGRALAKQLWVQCAHKLNSISPGCKTKSADNWRLFYNEYKSKISKKLRNQKAELQAIDGPASASITLTPLQGRLYDILFRDGGEPLEGVNQTLGSESIDEDPLTCESNSIEIKSEGKLSDEQNIRRSVSGRLSSQSESESYSASKLQYTSHDMPIAKKPLMDEAEVSLHKNGDEANECDLYGQLLAQKLKTLNVEDRLVLMNEIDNLVFKYVIKIKRRNSLARS